MARLTCEHLHDQFQTRYKLDPEEYVEEYMQATRQVAPDATPDGQEASTDRDAQRDHAEAERQSTVLTTGDLQNDIDTERSSQR